MTKYGQFHTSKQFLLFSNLNQFSRYALVNQGNSTDVVLSIILLGLGAKTATLVKRSRLTVRFTVANKTSASVLGKIGNEMDSP